MESTSFLGNSEHCFLPRRSPSKHLYIVLLYHVLHVSNWDHFTQDVLIVIVQLSTLWCEHHSPLSYFCTLAISKLLTFCLDPQCCSDQCKESGIEHDSPITVQWHIHGNKALQSKEKENNHTANRQTEEHSSLCPHDGLQTHHPSYVSIHGLWI